MNLIQWGKEQPEEIKLYLFGEHNAKLAEEFCGNELSKELCYDGECIGEIQPYLDDIVLVENVINTSLVLEILEEFEFDISKIELDEDGEIVFSTMEEVCVNV